MQLEEAKEILNENGFLLTEFRFGSSGSTDGSERLCNYLQHTNIKDAISNHQTKSDKYSNAFMRSYYMKSNPMLVMAAIIRDIIKWIPEYTCSDKIKTAWNELMKDAWLKYTPIESDNNLYIYNTINPNDAPWRLNFEAIFRTNKYKFTDFIYTPKTKKLKSNFEDAIYLITGYSADKYLKDGTEDELQAELNRILDKIENEDKYSRIEKEEEKILSRSIDSSDEVFVLPKEMISVIRNFAKDDDNIISSKVGKIDKNQVKECYSYCSNVLNKRFHVGKTGIFDLNIQDFYNTYKIVFLRGFNDDTLHKIFNEVCYYLIEKLEDKLDSETSRYWKEKNNINPDELDDFNESINVNLAKKLLKL